LYKTNMPEEQVQHKEHCITFQDVLDAASRIKGTAFQTPVMTSTSIDQLCGNGHNLFFKVEALQRTGSFKFRGALNSTLSMLEDLTNNGDHGQDGVHVVTHSSGNHAAAVALAARIASNNATTNSDGNGNNQSVRATIVMPENAPIIKVNGVNGFGGNIVFVESTNEARESMADAIVQEQGAVCLEFIQQVRDRIDDDLDVVIIPVGGGGLAAGNTIALRGILGNKVKIILAEPEVMDDAKRSKEAGKLLGHDPGNKLNSVADGLKTTLGPNTWPIIRDLVDDIITVSEHDILSATKLIWERLKVCIEPSAGVAVAVALGNQFTSKYTVEDGYSKVGIILCGGNVDVLKIAELMRESDL